jgi:hypothetical protein
MEAQLALPEVAFERLRVLILAAVAGTAAPIKGVAARTVCAGRLKGPKWDVYARLTESKGLKNLLDIGVTISLLLHHKAASAFAAAVSAKAGAGL